MRVLITGGAGFIGSHLCEVFVSRGWEVICVDNFITGQRSNTEHLANNPRFVLLNQDVVTGISVDGPVDYVLHFASPASPRDFRRYALQILNVGAMGTRNALELSRAKQAKFLLASTSECYGDPTVNPQPETYWGNVNPIGVRAAYDEAKRFAEALTMAYHRVYGQDTRIARIFNTYGPRMRQDDGRAIPTMLLQALRAEEITVYGDGQQTRSFCYISDMVEGILRLMESDEREPVNLGNPEEITILQVANLIRQITGSQSPIVFQEAPPDDPRRRCPDISKARRVLQWQPKVFLREGLDQTRRYFAKALSLC